MKYEIIGGGNPFFFYFIMHRSTEQQIKRTNENDIKAEQNALVSAKARREFGVSDKNINTPKLTRSDSFGLKPKASNSIEKSKIIQ